jgi:hypothetical protein
MQTLEQEVHQLEAEVEMHRRNVGITARHETLLDFIQGRLDRGDYEKHLGLLHQVQQDIKELSETLLLRDPKEDAEANEICKLFPRGKPRVILIVDDLDRCPPDRVVEVLEAAQLLVRTSLFVVVLAMDVRYITKSLEKAYAGVLIRDGMPSGLDYIEKIVQIPYRVPPIARKAMPGYIRSQVRVEEKAEPVTGPGQGGFSGLGKAAMIGTAGDGEARLEAALPIEVQEFNEAELEMLERCTLAVKISPRSTKRLVNVMKLIKIIWYRRGEEEPEDDVKRAMILLLALSARYNKVMRRILLELEKGYLGSVDNYPTRKLELVMSSIFKEWSVEEGRIADWDTVSKLIKDKQMLENTVTMGKIKLTNIQLVRSYSFVGEIDVLPAPETHQLDLEVSKPVEIKSPGVKKRKKKLETTS